MIHNIFVISKDGRCLFHRNYGEVVVDEILISGFLSAIHSFGKEIGQEDIRVLETLDTKMTFLSEENFLVVATIDQLDDVDRIILILESLTEQFSKEFGKYVPDWTGDTSVFRGFEKNVTHTIFGKRTKSKEVIEKLNEIHLVEYKGDKWINDIFSLSHEKIAKWLLSKLDYDNLSDLGSIYYIVVSLALLGKIEDVNAQEILDHISMCQNIDGGFGEKSGEPSKIWDTFTSILILYLFDGLKFVDKSRVVGWLFRSYSHLPLSLENTYYFLIIFKLLESINEIDREGFAESIVSRHLPDGGFQSDFIKDESSVDSTFQSLIALKLLNSSISKKEEIIWFLRKNQKKDGGFSDFLDQKRSTIYETFHAISCLKILESLDKVNKEKIIDYTFSIFNKEGYFCDETRRIKTPLRDTFYALLTLVNLIE